METVDHSAVIKNGIVFAVPQGQGHDKARLKACEFFGLNDIGEHESGFSTSEGRYVSRSEAAFIAFTAGQISVAVKELSSADLWPQPWPF